MEEAGTNSGNLLSAVQRIVANFELEELGIWTEEYLSPNKMHEEESPGRAVIATPRVVIDKPKVRSKGRVVVKPNINKKNVSDDQGSKKKIINTKVMNVNEEDIFLDEGFEKELEDNGKPFRLSIQRIMLTYKTHINKTDLEQFIRNKSKRPCPTIISAHENGENDPRTPYEHTHTCIDFGSAMDSKSCRIFDWKTEEGEMIHPHFKLLKFAKAFRDCLVYISKEDPEVADMLPDPSIMLGALNCIDTKDAIIKFGKKFSDVNGIISLMKFKGNEVADIPFEELEVPRNQWQFDLIEELKERRPVSHRKVIWIFDTWGRSGKSNLGDWLEGREPLKWIAEGDFGNSSNAATKMLSWYENGFQFHGITIDLQVTMDSDPKRIFQYLEPMLDGKITALKYLGGHKKIRKPWVVVFANWPPIVSALISDRWDIREIQEDYSLKKCHWKEFIGDNRRIRSIRYIRGSNGELAPNDETMEYDNNFTVSKELTSNVAFLSKINPV